MKKLILIFALLMPDLLLAEAAYVTDNLEVSVRSGQSTRNRILKMLESGDAVTILERNAESGYALVKTSEGIEGWILSRYLMSKPSARQELRNLKDSIVQLKQDNDSYKQELSDLRQDNSQVNQTRENIIQKNNRLQKELDEIRETAANAMSVERQRDQLQKQLIDLQRENQQLKREKQILEDSTQQDWYLIGAGVMFAGILFGLLIPKISWRKKTSSWDSF